MGGCSPSFLIGILSLFVLYTGLGNGLNKGPHPAPPFAAKNPEVDICMPCVSLLQRDLVNLIKIVSDVGVLVSCSDICGKLNSTVDIGVCTTLCDIAGYDVFWKIFTRADVDPILACELMGACLIPSHPAATFQDPIILPAFGVSGQSFGFLLKFEVINATGVGQLAYEVYSPLQNQKIIYEELFESYQPGLYSANFTLKTYANSSFPAGQYPVLFLICAGECGGKGPYSFMLDQAQSFFNLTTAPSSVSVK